MSRRKGRPAKSTVGRHTVSIAGRNTSVSLEDAFWEALKEIAGERGMTPPELIRAINSERQRGNLSSAIRLLAVEVDARAVPMVVEMTALSRIARKIGVEEPSALSASIAHTRIDDSAERRRVAQDRGRRAETVGPRCQTARPVAADLTTQCAPISFLSKARERDQ